MALDRLPNAGILAEARNAADKNNGKLLLCIGGNGRSNGFPGMVARPKARARFISNLLQVLEEKGLDGVDYNWEYPGTFSTC
jgi:GH18 family chitinase